MMTASQLEPRLHLTPPVLTRPDFGKTLDEDYMTVARANGQVKKIFIFSVLSQISVQKWEPRECQEREWRCTGMPKSMHNLS